jgi:hypothetical protein
MSFAQTGKDHAADAELDLPVALQECSQVSGSDIIIGTHTVDKSWWNKMLSGLDRSWIGLSGLPPNYEACR